MKTDKAQLKLSYDTTGKEWKMAKDMGSAQGPGNYPKLKVDYDNVGEFTFTILNPKGLTFAATNPLTPKAGKGNPADFADQFSVSPGGSSTLTVKIANANKAGGPYAGGDYHYNLHFSDGSLLDPVVTNSGCCNKKDSNAMAYFAVGAVALIAIFVLLIRPMLAKR